MVKVHHAAKLYDKRFFLSIVVRQIDSNMDFSISQIFHPKHTKSSFSLSNKGLPRLWPFSLFEMFNHCTPRRSTIFLTVSAIENWFIVQEEGIVIDMKMTEVTDRD